MFLSASDASFADLATVNLTLLSTIFGAVRNHFERDPPASQACAVRDQLTTRCVAYLQAVASAKRVA